MSPKIKAFTLIELLVVISIVALLIALLLPAIKQAKNLGKKVTCASNQRQLGIGLLHYTADNDNYSPIPYGYPDAIGVGVYVWYPSVPGWRGLGLIFDDRPPTTWPAHNGGPAGSGPGGAGYIRDKNIFYCPMTHESPGQYDIIGGWPDHPGTNGHHSSPVDYSMRQHKKDQGTRLEDLEEGRMAWIFDNGVVTADQPHPFGGFNVLFPDGHVKWMSFISPPGRDLSIPSAGTPPRWYVHLWLKNHVDGNY